MSKLSSSWINKEHFETQAFSWLELFYKNLKSEPEKTAVIFQTKHYSYKELDELSNWFAEQIYSSSDAANPFVGICTKRSHLMLAAMIGTAKAGKAYLPLDPYFPDDRLLYMLEDSGASVLITDDFREDGLLINVDKKIHKISTSDSRPLCCFEHSCIQTDEQPAYILYTSGSTGKPKGVVVRHKAFLNFLLSMKKEPGFESSDTLLAITTISFDISGLELFLPLISGGSVHIVTRDTVLNPIKLIQIIEEADITMMQATPVLWKILCDYGFSGKPRFKILCGGDIFPLDLSVRLFETGCAVWNMYGPTETTIWSSVFKLTKKPEKAPYIGLPIANTGFHILDENMIPVKPGDPGVLWISGDGLADGYWNKKELTDSVFRFCEAFPGLRLYNTGDWVFETEDGNISFSGRKDNQIKIRGFRIEAGEIEQALNNLEEIRDAVVLPREDSHGNTVLAAFILAKDNIGALNAIDLRGKLSRILPDYMIPSVFKQMKEFPMTLNNKIDRSSFPSFLINESELSEDKLDLTELYSYIRNLWMQALGHSDFTDTNNFFDVGGYSMLVIDMLQKLKSRTGRDISALDFFEHPTVDSLYFFLTKNESMITNEQKIVDLEEPLTSDSDDFSLAIIGMSCAVPGAENVNEFWNLLAEGQCGISEHSRDELLSEGLSPNIIDKPNYINKSGILPSTKYFDNDFFGYSPNEAKFMDPQHRLFLQHCYKAIESAGINFMENQNKIAVFAGAGQNKYLIKNILCSNEKDDWSDFQTMIGNENDFLASRVSYKLNLKGPSVTIQTACSTSLVAIQMGYQSLLNYQSDMALCGGVSLNVPVREGYLYDEGSILSPVGECRAFDADASGTVFGSGVGVVLLKRLTDAVRDKDPVIAIIRGVAINNDGADKIGFTAPSVKGQSEVITEALNLADVKPEQISYVEAHGTGTLLGDPIEISGLKKAYGDLKDSGSKCYLGSVKTNIGHLDAASGVVGVIKTALSLLNKKIPPSLNFIRPNPAMKIEESHFIVNSELREWEPVEGRMIAGVSSFGIGGTNAHLILESYNSETVESPSYGSEHLIFPVSAKNSDVQKEYLDVLYSTIEGLDVFDRVKAANTLINYRPIYPLRGFFVLPQNNIMTSDDFSSCKIYSSIKAFDSPKIVMLFPGQGAQYSGMASGLYQKNVIFKNYLERCINIINKITGWHSLDMILNNRLEINHTEYTQPLLFSVEWAIGKTLIDYGLIPDYLIGHSLGEYSAACIAGAFSLEEGLQLVIERGRIMAGAGEGLMLAVFSDYESIKDLVIGKVDVAGINSSTQVVLSGPHQAIEEIQELLDHSGITSKLLGTSSAFHSVMMDTVLDEFKTVASKITYNKLQKTVISNLTGEQLTPGYIYTPEYWVEHLRGTILFEKGISSLSGLAELVFVEVGPGSVLSRFVRTIMKDSTKNIIQTLPSQMEGNDDLLFFIKSIGNIWKSGCSIDLNIVNSIKCANRINLPTYPFLKKELWIYSDKKLDQIQTEISTNEILTSSEPELNNTNDITSRLKQIWTDILGCTDINDTSNFYELGGDSLSSSSLLKKINKEFAVTLELKNILISPVFDNQINLINQNKNVAKNENGIIQLNNSNSDEYIYFVVGIQIYKHLAERLTDLGKCYGVYLQEEELLLDGVVDDEKWTVERLANNYKKIIKSHCEQKKISIVGVSFGGVIAYEVAKLLSKDGVDINLVVMLDSLLPNARKRKLLKWTWFHFIDILKNGFSPISKIISKRIKDRSSEENINLALDKRLIVYSKAVSMYVKTRHDIYNRKSLLIKANDTISAKGYYFDKYYGWGDYIDTKFLNTEISPGGHLDMLKSDVIDLTSDLIRKYY